jgi:tRNA pseudouridine38-40 synthase
MRVALGIEYDGSSYCGWQFQDGVPTVQDQVEQALSQVADSMVRVVTAGRTDTGVHATGQVIHFDTEAVRSDYSWQRGATRYLPDDICVLWAMQVDESFHARFSAIERHYRYIILNRAVRPAIERNRVTWEYRPLDVDLMRQAAKHLIGRHDFNAYRAVACQAKSPVRELRELSVQRFGDYIVIEARADGFLHHMIRNIAGVLCSIGAGERAVDWSAEVLDSRDRTVAGVTAPPDGLYLTGVLYPDEYKIPFFVNNQPYMLGL